MMYPPGDVPGTDPHVMFQNLSDFLKSRPEEDGMKIGEEFTVKTEYKTQPAVLPWK